MKYLIKIVTIIFIALSSYSNMQAQVSCSELTEEIISQGNQISSYCCFDSEFLTNVKFYSITEGYESYYFAIVQIDYMNEYTYCIPYSAISDFSLYAYSDQAGEAFHQYIKPYKCDCY